MTQKTGDSSDSGKIIEQTCLVSNSAQLLGLTVQISEETALEGTALFRRCVCVCVCVFCTENAVQKIYDCTT